MNQLAAKEKEIRAFVDEHGSCKKHFKPTRDEFNLLCVAMDTLGDSCSALGHYEKAGIGVKVGEKYIGFYGMFQAIILQQDSISQLFRFFTKSELIPLNTSAWQEIRNLRNMATGHPLDKNGNPQEGKLRISVSQTSMSNTEFTMVIYEQQTGKRRIQEVDLQSVYDNYKKEALDYLPQIVKVQEGARGVCA